MCGTPRRLKEYQGGYAQSGGASQPGAANREVVTKKMEQSTEERIIATQPRCDNDQSYQRNGHRKRAAKQPPP